MIRGRERAFVLRRAIVDIVGGMVGGYLGGGMGCYEGFR